MSIDYTPFDNLNGKYLLTVRVACVISINGFKLFEFGGKRDSRQTR